MGNSQTNEKQSKTGKSPAKGKHFIRNLNRKSSGRENKKHGRKKSDAKREAIDREFDKTPDSDNNEPIEASDNDTVECVLKTPSREGEGESASVQSEVTVTRWSPVRSATRDQALAASPAASHTAGSEADSVFTDPLTPLAVELNLCYYSAESSAHEQDARARSNTLTPSDMPHDDAASAITNCDMHKEEKSDIFDNSDRDDEKVMGGLLSRGENLERSTHECNHEFRENRLKSCPGQTSFTVSKHRKVELAPVSCDVVLLDNALSEIDRRHSSLSDTPMDSNVLRKVASLTLEKNSETRVSRPKFVPEKLNFQLYEKFEGQMLLNWFLSSVSENNHLKHLLSPQDLKNLGIQYCTHLLAAGVLRQISDKNAPIESVFKPNLMYYWSKMEAPASQPVTPGRLHMAAWPPDKESPHSLQENYIGRCSLETKWFNNKNNNEEINDLDEAKNIISELKRKVQELENQLEKQRINSQIEALSKTIVKSMDSPSKRKVETANKEVQTNEIEEEVYKLSYYRPVITIPDKDPIRTNVNNFSLSSPKKNDMNTKLNEKPEVRRSEKVENYCKLNKSRELNKFLKKEELSELADETIDAMNQTEAAQLANVSKTTSTMNYESSSEYSFRTTCDSSELLVIHPTVSSDSSKKEPGTPVKSSPPTEVIYSIVVKKHCATHDQLSSDISNSDYSTANEGESRINKITSPISQLKSPENSVRVASDKPIAPVKTTNKTPPKSPPVTKTTAPVSPPSLQGTPKLPSKFGISPSQQELLPAISELGISPPMPNQPEMPFTPIIETRHPSPPEPDIGQLPPKPGLDPPQLMPGISSKSISIVDPTPIPPPPPPMPEMGPPPPPMPEMGPPPPPMPGMGPPPPPMPGMGPPPPPMPGMGPPPPPMPGMGPPPPPMPGMGPPPPPMPGMGPPPPPMPGMGPPPPMPGVSPPPPPMPTSSGPPPPPGMPCPDPPLPLTSSGPVPFPAPPIGGWNVQRATLRKTPVKPAAPMKPLYWTRILAIPPLPTCQGESDTKNLKPLWLEIEETKLDNIDEFTDLFSRQVVKAPVKKKVEVKSKIQPVKILDSKRSQNVGILAQSLHLEFSEIENAIYNFDTSVVSLEALQQIYELRATEEEQALIRQHLETKPEIPLDRPEAFLHDLSGISNFAERISCFMFQAEFEDSVSTTMHKLDNLKHTCEFLLTSESLKKLFAIILTLGNYMNGGNGQRGQADGFGLEILSKLKDVKSKQSNVTLLHFVVRTYMRACGGALSDACVLPIPEPGDVVRAAALDFADVGTHLTTLRKQLEACKEKTKKVIESDPVAQPDVEETIKSDSGKRLEVFKDKMTSFINSAEEKLKTENENLEECRTKFIATMKFYQFTPKCGKIEECEPKEFFLLWTGFCSDFKDIYKKEEQLAIKEKLKEAKKLQHERKSLTQPKKEGGLKARLQKLSNSRKS